MNRKGAVVVLPLLVLIGAYIGTYFCISRTRRAEWRASYGPENCFTYVSMTEMSRSEAAEVRDGYLALIFSPINALDRGFGGPSYVCTCWGLHSAK